MLRDNVRVLRAGQRERAGQRDETFAHPGIKRRWANYLLVTHVPHVARGCEAEVGIFPDVERECGIHRVVPRETLVVKHHQRVKHHGQNGPWQRQYVLLDFNFAIDVGAEGVLADTAPLDHVLRLEVAAGLLRGHGDPGVDLVLSEGLPHYIRDSAGFSALAPSWAAAGRHIVWAIPTAAASGARAHPPLNRPPRGYARHQ
mmetsp:Transcript_1512/g.3600  ORF Transcript_1512/g.3600 Transcript_1512/m.3600 type:complete len:201 (+) Transcript_1512:1580-2182(+)